MTAKLSNAAVDVGLITRDAEPQLAFYRDLLGLVEGGSVEIPGVGTVTRLAAGNSTLRLMVPVKPPQDRPAGPFVGSVGIGYLALRIANLDETLAAVESAGFKIVIPKRELRPGVFVALLQDADGNTVELMQESGV